MSAEQHNLWLITSCAEPKSGELFPFQTLFLCFNHIQHWAAFSQGQQTLGRRRDHVANLIHSAHKHFWKPNNLCCKVKENQAALNTSMMWCDVHTFNIIHLFLELELQLQGGRQKKKRERPNETMKAVCPLIVATGWNDHWIKPLGIKEHYNTRAPGVVNGSSRRSQKCSFSPVHNVQESDFNVAGVRHGWRTALCVLSDRF